MDQFEAELKHQSRSWKALLGAALTTGVLFLLIASTSIVIKEPPALEAEPLVYEYIPPPPVTPRKQTTPPLSSSIAESFKFDPTVESSPPDVQLDLLDIRLAPEVDPDRAIALDMQRTFEVQKPADINANFVFEVDEVDEIPVWVYGPVVPRLPEHLRRTVADVLVLFVVTEKGKTENIFVLDSPDPDFAQPTIDMIRKWTFRPARKDGKPVRVWAQQLLTYRPRSTSPFSI